MIQEIDILVLLDRILLKPTRYGWNCSILNLVVIIYGSLTYTTLALDFRSCTLTEDGPLISRRNGSLKATVKLGQCRFNSVNKLSKAWVIAIWIVERITIGSIHATLEVLS